MRDHWRRHLSDLLQLLEDRARAAQHSTTQGRPRRGRQAGELLAALGAAPPAPQAPVGGVRVRHWRAGAHLGVAVAAERSDGAAPRGAPPGGAAGGVRHCGGAGGGSGGVVPGLLGVARGALRQLLGDEEGEGEGGKGGRGRGTRGGGE